MCRSDQGYVYLRGILMCKIFFYTRAISGAAAAAGPRRAADHPIGLKYPEQRASTAADLSVMLQHTAHSRLVSDSHLVHGIHSRHGDGHVGSDEGGGGLGADLYDIQEHSRRDA